MAGGNQNQDRKKVHLNALNDKRNVATLMGAADSEAALMEIRRQRLEFEVDEELRKEQT